MDRTQIYSFLTKAGIEVNKWINFKYIEEISLESDGAFEIDCDYKYYFDMDNSMLRIKFYLFDTIEEVEKEVTNNITDIYIDFVNIEKFLTGYVPTKNYNDLFYQLLYKKWMGEL